MSVIQKLQKRRRYPVKVGGEEVFVRAMLLSEQREAMKFKDDECSLNFAIGCGLIGEDGKPEFKRADNETVEDFGDRVATALEEVGVPVDTRGQLATAIIKLTNGPSAEQIKVIEKN